MKRYLIQLGWSHIGGFKTPIMAPDTLAFSKEDALLCVNTSYPDDELSLCGCMLSSLDSSESWKRLSEDHRNKVFEIKFPN